MPLMFFDTFQKYQKTSNSLVILGGIEGDQQHEMGWKNSIAKQILYPPLEFRKWILSSCIKNRWIFCYSNFFLISRLVWQCAFMAMCLFNWTGDLECKVKRMDGSGYMVCKWVILFNECPKFFVEWNIGHQNENIHVFY